MFTFSKIKIFTALTLLSPLFACAQAPTFRELVVSLIALINNIIPVIIGLAVLWTLWGILKLIAQADNEEERKKGKNRIIQGIIGLFVIVSVWGIVAVVRNTLGI